MTHTLIGQERRAFEMTDVAFLAALMSSRVSWSSVILIYLSFIMANLHKNQEILRKFARINTLLA